MVISDTFAWAHIGKTGGDATAIYFSYFKKYMCLSIDPQETKHSRFPDRGITDENKILILNIRRLPSFILSHIHHFNQQGKVNFVDDVLYNDFYLPNRSRLRDLGDGYLNQYTSNNTLKISRWFRSEFLIEDIADFMANQVPASKEQIIEVLSKLGTKPKQNYDHDINLFWKPEHIARMYENNPQWAKIEKQEYGDLI